MSACVPEDGGFRMVVHPLPRVAVSDAMQCIGRQVPAATEVA